MVEAVQGNPGTFHCIQNWFPGSTGKASISCLLDLSWCLPFLGRNGGRDERDRLPNSELKWVFLKPVLWVQYGIDTAPRVPHGCVIGENLGGSF